MSNRKTRRILIASFPGAQILDVTGPLEVFSTTNRLLAEDDPGSPRPYRL